jgi:hypothetical protein
MTQHKCLQTAPVWRTIINLTLDEDENNGIRMSCELPIDLTADSDE